MDSATPEETATVERILRPTRETSPSYEQYVAELVERASADLREAERGLGTSAVKEGLEILRDHRDGLRAAVDPPGLTEESHRYFMSEYVPLVNRTVIGPQKERIDELLRLMAAGVVVPGPGPRAELSRDGDGWVLTSTALDEPHRIAADLVIKANMDWPVIDPELDPIACSLRDWAAPAPTARCVWTGTASSSRPRVLTAPGRSPSSGPRRGGQLLQPLRAVTRRLVPCSDRPRPCPRARARHRTFQRLSRQRPACQ